MKRSGREKPAITLFEVKTLEAQTDESFAQERLLAILSGYAGAFAVLSAPILALTGEMGGLESLGFAIVSAVATALALAVLLVMIVGRSVWRLFR